MTKSTITRERLQEIAEDGFLKHGESKELARMALSAMDQKPAIHRYRRKAVEPYGPYPWHYEEFVDLSRPLEGIEDEYYYAAPPAVSGFAVDGEPAENHIGSKNALDAIVSFIKSKSNPTVKCYEEVSEQLFKDNCHGIHSHVIEYILKLGEELEDLRAEQDESQLAAVVPDERDKTVDADDHPLLWSFNEGWNACRAAILQAQSDDDCEPTDDERIMTIEGIHNCERCGDEGWVVGEMGITRCACGQSGNSPANPGCWCRTCRPVAINDMRFVVCPDCGNKRCPRANDHRNACTGSNEPGQEGSAYPADPQEIPDGK